MNAEMSRRTLVAACAGAAIAPRFAVAQAVAAVPGASQVASRTLVHGPTALASRPTAPAVPRSASATVLEVGPGKKYPSLTGAFEFANRAWGGGYGKYDEVKNAVFQIKVTPGPNDAYYDDDTCTYSPRFGNHGGWPPFAGVLHGPLILEGVPGALVNWKITQDGSLYYGKGQLITSDFDLTVRRMKMGGDIRRQTTGNFSAIRFDTLDNGRTARTGNFLIEDCEFFDCDNGILGGSAGQNLTLRRCHFHDCGNGDGQSHNAYCALFDTVWAEDILSHHCKIGHLFKSRAATTVLLRCRLVSDGGSESACLDVPNGGIVWVEDTLMVKGAGSDASWTWHYGGETDANVAPRPNSIVVVRGLTMAGPKRLTKDGSSPEGFVNQSAIGLARGQTDGVNAVQVGVDPSSSVEFFGFAPNRVGFAKASPLSSMPAIDLASPVRLT